MDMGAEPVVIGGSGGSGTRVFARMAAHAGRFMGSSISKDEDSKPFIEFYDAYVPLYLKRSGRLSVYEHQAVSERFHEALQQHLVGLPNPQTPWGIKSPQSMLMLKLWHEMFPRMRFVHVVRHGLDMVFAKGHQGLLKHQGLVLNEGERKSPRRAKAAMYWTRMNVATADYGRRHLNGRYLLLRFEDVCADPRRVAEQLFAFLGVTPEARRVDAAVAEVSAPASIGRWREHSVREVNEAIGIARDGLERFGYWDRAGFGELSAAAKRAYWRRGIFRLTRMKRMPSGVGGSSA